MIIDKELNVMQRKRSAVVADLRAKRFRPFPKIARAKAAGEEDDEGDEAESEVAAGPEGADSDYDYLLNMAIYSLTAEKVAKLNEQRDAKEEELNILLGYTPKDLWNQDLDSVQSAWEQLLEEDAREIARDQRGKKKSGKVTVKAQAGGAARRRSTNAIKEDGNDSGDDFIPDKPKPAAKRRAPAKTPASKTTAPKVEPKTEPGTEPSVKPESTASASRLGIGSPPTASGPSRTGSRTGSGASRTVSGERKPSVKRSASSALDDDDLDMLTSNKKAALEPAAASASEPGKKDSRGKSKQTTLPLSRSSKAVYLSDSEDVTGIEEGDTELAKSTPAQAAPAKPAPVKSALTKTSRAPAKKTGARATTASSASGGPGRGRGRKGAATPAGSDDNGDGDDTNATGDDSVGNAPPPPPPRTRSTRATRGAATKAKYVISEDEENEDQEESADDFEDDF